MNHPLFTCRLTKDPELCRVGSDKNETSVVTLRVAVDDRQRSKQWSVLGRGVRIAG